jgi:phosphoribosyl 1,2-cyclic phosphodiesterase
LKWLGTAGWEIKFGGAVILIDPFFTRMERAPNAEWKTNEEEVLKSIVKADYIFAGHSHADHIADIPVYCEALRIQGHRFQNYHQYCVDCRGRINRS